MKSSSNRYIAAEDLSDASTWIPGGFESEEKLAQDPRIEEILAIFNGQFPGAETSTIKGTGSFIPSGGIRTFQGWNPEEINWVAPFQTKVWNTWEEFNRPQFTGDPAQAAESTDHLPNPEEEMIEMLASARIRAEEIILEAQSSAEEAIQQAQDEIRKSIEDGYQQGRKAAQAEAVSILQAAHQIVAELTRWREEMLANSESSMLAMIRDIARFMFGDGVKLDEMGLQMNLSRILENAKSLGDVRIFINPGDAIRLDPAWKEYQSMLTGNKVIIVPSDSIKPGGCFVQGETGSIDARVEAQLGAVMGVLSSSGEVD